MEMRSVYEQIVQYHYIVRDNNLLDNISENYFEEKSIIDCYKLAKNYIKSYNALPSAEIIKQLAVDDGNTSLTPDIIDSIYAKEDVVNDVDKAFYVTNITGMAKYKKFCEGLVKAVSYLKTSEANLDGNNAIEYITKAKTIFESNSELNFQNEEDYFGLDFFNAESHLQKNMERWPTGYWWIDKCMKGGYWKGSLHVIAGGAKAGKSTWLANLCAKSVMNGNNSVYITLEMPAEMVMQRLGSIMLNIPINDYENFATESNIPLIAERLRDFRSSSFNKFGHLSVKKFPTSTLTAPALEAYLLADEKRISAELGEEFHYRTIYLDYLNIMCGRNPNSESTYMNIKRLAEDVRAIAERNGWSIITLTQTNKQAANASDINVSDVAESHGLLATVDTMFGIICTESMKRMGQYYLKCMADRVVQEENKKLMFYIDGNYMKIDDNTTDDVIDCTEEFGESTPSNYQSRGNYGIGRHDYSKQSTPNQQPIMPKQEKSPSNGLLNSINEMNDRVNGPSLGGFVLDGSMPAPESKPSAVSMPNLGGGVKVDDTTNQTKFDFGSNYKRDMYG